jgi:predicted ATP-grasp superfamily ATP-dependent carboligase
LGRKPFLKIFITDAKLNSTLATIRSLGRLKVKIFVGDETKNALSFFSRYIQKRILYPHPLENPKDFLEEIVNITEKEKIDLLIPMTDYTLLLFSKYRNRFSKRLILPIPEYRTVLKVIDKRETFKIAKELNIPIPHTIFLDNLDDLESLSYSLNYPLVIKSRYAAYYWEEKNKIVRGKIIYVNNPSDFILEYRKLHQFSPYPLIQELIIGEGYGFFTLLDRDGEYFAKFFHHRVREANPKGSASSLCESILENKKMEEDGLKLLRAISWWGPAMVEFKKDKRDKRYKLMEVNGRLWGSLCLAIYSGVDFPKLFYQLALGRKIERVERYRSGILARHLRGDINHLIQVLKGAPKGYEELYPSKFSTLKNFFMFEGSKLRYYNFQKNDLIPGFVDLWQYFSLMFKRIFI